MKFFNILKKFILLVFIILIFLLLFESSLRIVRYVKYENCLTPSEQKDMYEPDERVGYVLKKNLKICKYNNEGQKLYFFTNEVRTRNIENFIDINTSKKRIIVVGDSMVAGFYTDHNDSYAEKLKKYLGDNYDVIAIGGSGYSIDKEFLVLQDKIILGLKPDIVIQNIYDNDYIYDTELNNFYGSNERFMLGIESATGNVLPIVFGENSKEIFGDSYIDGNKNNNYFELTTEQVRNKLLLKFKIDGDIEDNEPIMKKSYVYNFISEKLFYFKNKPKTIYQDIPYLALMYDNYTNELNNSVLINFKLFDFIHKHGFYNNFTTVFVYLPDRAQIDDKYFEEAHKHIIFPNNKSIDKEAINKIQVKLMHDNNYYYLDLLPNFRNVFDVYYDKDNPHWNAKGNDIAAKAVADYLKKNSLV